LQSSQYTGKEFQKRLVVKRIMRSMSGKGKCWHNAVVESFCATLKDELEILDGLIRDPDQLLCDFGYGLRGITTGSDAIPLLTIALQSPLRIVMPNVLS
jgi:transposase InsO family protein